MRCSTDSLTRPGDEKTSLSGRRKSGESRFRICLRCHITSQKKNYGRLEVVEAGGALDEEIFSVLNDKNEDIRGLKQLAIYGCKGMAAYARHALNLGYEQEDIYAVIENALAEIKFT